MEVNTREINNIVIYDLKGAFCLSDEIAATVHQSVKDRLESGAENFVFNFDDVDYIDSFGVGELVACYISIAKMRGRLRLMKIPEKIRILFRITILDKIFDIFDDEESTIKSFEQP